MKSNTSSIFQKIFVFVAFIVFVASLIIAYMNTAQVEGELVVDFLLIHCE